MTYIYLLWTFACLFLKHDQHIHTLPNWYPWFPIHNYTYICLNIIFHMEWTIRLPKYINLPVIVYPQQSMGPRAIISNLSYLSNENLMTDICFLCSPFYAIDIFMSVNFFCCYMQTWVGQLIICIKSHLMEKISKNKLQYYVLHINFYLPSSHPHFMFLQHFMFCILNPPYPHPHIWG